MDSKLAEELLRQEVAEATGSCLEAAKAEATGTKAHLTAQIRDLRSDLEGKVGEVAVKAAVEGRAAMDKVASVESKVR